MALSQGQVRALDQLRQRLFQLAQSLQVARLDLERNELLPKWDELQSAAQLIAHNLSAVSELLSTHQQFLTQAHAYPLPHFPGVREEGVLGDLLRKKLDPSVEDWIVEYTTETQTQANGPAGEGKRNDGLHTKDLHELWSWAGPASNEIARGMLEGGAWNDDFTLQEREDGVERIVTGLRRKLDGGEEDDEDEDDEDAMMDTDDVMTKPSGRPHVATKPNDVDTEQPAMPVDTVLAFVTNGSLPNDIR